MKEGRPDCGVGAAGPAVAAASCVALTLLLPFKLWLRRAPLLSHLCDRSLLPACPAPRLAVQGRASIGDAARRHQAAPEVESLPVLVADHHDHGGAGAAGHGVEQPQVRRC